jgi:hypothetical protein
VGELVVKSADRSGGEKDLEEIEKSCFVTQHWTPERSCKQERVPQMPYSKVGILIYSQVTGERRSVISPCNFAGFLRPYALNSEKRIPEAISHFTPRLWGFQRLDNLLPVTLE